jgi:hypothetical protein
MIDLRLALYGAVLAAIVGTGMWLHHSGYEAGLRAQRDADEKGLEAARVAAQAKEDHWRNQYAAAQKSYEDEAAKNATAPALGSVRVCHDAARPRPVPAAAAGSGGQAPGAGGVPSGDAVPVAGPDIGRSLELLARSADSVVAECRRRVAGPPSG